MNPEVKAEWLKALRSGEYKQCRGSLAKHNQGYCCLGVLADVVDKKFPELLKEHNLSVVRTNVVTDEGVISMGIKYELGTSYTGIPYGFLIDHHQQQILTTMNDVKYINFDGIADYIEKT